MKPVHAPRTSLPVLALLGATFIASEAQAQPAPPVPPPPPVVVPVAPPRAQAPAVDPIALALAPHPGGLTPQDVGKVAAKTRHSVRAKQAELRAAAAKVDQAFVGFFPRVTLSATYTRLSEVPAFDLSKLLPEGFTIPSGGTGLPLIVNSYSFVASVAVPISDYLLRLSQGYAAASRAEKARRFEVEAEALQVSADAKIVYFNWVRARGTAVVAKEAVDQAKAHVDDANKAFSVGLISKTDVLRLEAQLAAAQQGAAEANAYAQVAGEQLRIVIALPPDRPLEIGSDVMNEPATPPTETLQALQDLAMQKRLEIRALDETQLSLKQAENIARAGYFPRLDAFGDVTYANPNPRYAPALERFDATWDAGLRLSWTLNDTFTAIGATAEARARVATIAEQKAGLKDALRVEVASAYADVLKAPTAIEAADRGVVASEENLRVRNELFRQGKTTSLDLTDAQTELTRARLRRLDARIGHLVAKTRLEHATGRDVPLRPVGE